MPKLVLASGSPRRQQLMTGLGLTFDVIVSHVDETVEENLPPEIVVETLAKRKGSAVLATLTTPTEHTLIISADTIVVVDGQILGKPADKDEAADMLRQLQGRTHKVYSAICIIDVMAKTTRVRHRVTEVRMKSLTDMQIVNYIETGEPMDKAGAYGIQGVGATLVDSIQGDFFNVVGLSMALLTDMLADVGYPVLG